MNKVPEENDWAETEKRLEPQCVSFFRESMDMPEEVAREIFQAFVQDLKEAAQREGTYGLPGNFGEILLERERTDEKVHGAFFAKRAEGVTDEDIAFWWNMPDLERRMICKIDEMNRVVLFEKLVADKTLSELDAARAVAKRYPVYGDTEHLVLENEDDRPLPYELKWRVNRYISKRTGTDPDGYQEEVDASTSVNALLRRALRDGKL